MRRIGGRREGPHVTPRPETVSVTVSEPRQHPVPALPPRPPVLGARRGFTVGGGGALAGGAVPPHGVQGTGRVGPTPP